MRNLKRALSLVMAMALIVGMMVISASAVSVKDFTDSDEIDHNEAVNTMVALNVIDGKEDGSYFDPTGTLTRAEMAKLVTYILNGGVEPVLGEKVTPTYSDIDGHWAEAYIEYCSSMGIIAGDGAGKFNPTGVLTASQAAKMLLTAMNYKDDIFGFLGNAWEINVNREANAAGLYKELGDIRASDPISRDDAAQMVYNAIQSKTMELTWSRDMQTGEITQTYQLVGPSLFTQKFNGTVYEGTLLASGYMAPYGVTAGGDRLAIRTAYIDGDADVQTIRREYDVDCTDMVGEYVKVLYNTKDKIIYGVYTVEDETTVSIDTTVGALSDVGDPVNTLTYDGVTYDVDAGARAYVLTNDTTWTAVNLATASGNVADNSAVANYDSIKLVDNDGDGILDVAFVVTNNIAKVTYVGTDTFTLTGKGSVKNADAIASDLAVDDYVGWNYKGASFENKWVVTEADKLSGKVTEVGKNSGNFVNRVLVDGTWYTLGQNALNVANTTTIVNDNGTELTYSTTYDMILFNGYVVYAEKVVGGNSQVAVVTGVTSVTDYDGNVQVRLLLADGTTVEGFMDKATTINPGDFVSYTMEDGIYKAKDMDADAEHAGYDNYDAGTGTDLFNPTNKTIDGTYKVNNDAVVFVWYDSDVTVNTPATREDAFRVTTGTELNSWKSNYGVVYELLSNNSGLGYADVVYIKGDTDEPTPGTSSNYGYITSAITEGSDGSGKYSAFTIWDGSSSTAVITRSNMSGIGKGDVVKFTWDGASEVKIDSVIGTTAALLYSNGEQVRLDNNGYDLADDVTIINVDTKNVAGVGGNAITTAAQTATAGVYYDNCWYVYDAANQEITLLVIDVTNSKLDGTTDGWDATNGVPVSGLS